MLFLVILSRSRISCVDMNFPCAVPPINCPSADSPLIGNVSAEAPDRPRSFGYKFFQDDSTFCTSEDPDIAALCNPPPPSNPPIPIIYSSNPQTCTVDCGDGTSQSYTAVAGSGVSIVSQADADVQAFNLACAVAAILCAGGIPVLYSNVPETCTVPCALGGSFSYTVAAGTFYSLNSQNEANLLAFQLACLIAADLCPLPIPLGSGPPPPAPPASPYFGNSPQSCSTTCASGGEFIYTVSAGMFTAESKIAANAIARSYACQQAAGHQVCLGEILSLCCAEESYSALIASTMTGVITWSVIAGVLPPGLSMNVFGLIDGVPITGGTYVFTIRQSNTAGLSATRTYSITVVEITTVALPDGDTSTPYSQALSVIGAGTSPTWSIVSGALPDGLTLQPFTGIISGTPTEADDFGFTVGVQPQGSAIVCEQDLEITINSVSVEPLEWWPLGAPNRIGAIHGLDLNFNFNVAFGVGVPGGSGGATLAPLDNGDNGIFTNLVYDPILHYDGNGFTSCAWVKMVPTNNCNVLLIVYAGTAGGSEQMRVELNYNPPSGAMTVNLFTPLVTTSGGVAISFPSNSNYNFFQFYYDPVAATIGVRVNNGAITTGPVVGVPVPVQPKGRVNCVFTEFDPGPQDSFVCEWVVYPFVLNTTQLDYLFNAGNGRTWPNSLP